MRHVGALISLSYEPDVFGLAAELQKRMLPKTTFEVQNR